MEDDRALDKIHMLYPEKGSRKGVSVDVVKSEYICSGLSSEEIAKKFKLSKNMVERVIKDNKLQELRKAYIIQGLGKIQSQQLDQAKKLLDLENKFKSLRIMQLEEVMESYAAYYARFGDLKKRHVMTGEILKDDYGIPLQIKVPNVSREIRDLKEAVSLSSGLTQVLDKLESIVNAGDPINDSEDPDVIDITDYNELFERSDDE